MKRIAVYAGSFDPVTYGHTDLIERASKMFDQVIVGIGVNSSKKPLFDVKHREQLLLGVCRKFENVTIESFDGLLIHFCEKKGASFIVRGLRAAMDFEYELGIAHANKTQDKGIDTLFLATSPEFSFVSSSVVKEIAKYGGIVRQFVDPKVEAALWQKFNANQYPTAAKPEEPQGSP